MSAPPARSGRPIDGADFIPPFCPRRTCRFHHRSAGWQWKKSGSHDRLAPPHRVQRFRCLACGRDFSVQTFRTTYWLKRPELQEGILRQVGACSAYRQIGRVLGCVHSTVLNQARRLGRHCLLFQRVQAPPGPPTEPVVLDGLRTFEYSQYWPFDLNHLTGKDSHFVYDLDLAELRRSGSMTDRQRRKRGRLEESHGRPDPRATRRSVEKLLRRVTGGPCKLLLYSDEHGAYKQAVKDLEGWQLQHETISSKAPRNPQNPLFSANLFDLLVRHDGANHKRETIAWSKRRQSALLRAKIFQVDRNWMRGVRAREGLRSATPAMRRGLCSERLTPKEVLSKRLFPTHVALDEGLEEAYYERIPTRQIPSARQHELVYAY